MRRPLGPLLLAAMGLALVACGDAGGADTAACSTTLHLDPASLATALSDGAQANGIVGVQAAVRVCADRWTSGAGMADRDTSARMTGLGLYRGASTTKTFTAARILQLVANGALGLEDHLSRWRPTYPGADAITVRMLLGHTSGAFSYTDDASFLQTVIDEPTRKWTPDELLGIAAQHAAYFAPGAGFHYSNTNYILLGLIEEAVGGASAAAQLHEHILAPLGLNDTFLDPPDTFGPLVRGYTHSIAPDGSIDPTGSSPLRDATFLGDFSFAWTAGAIVTTVDDEAEFLRALLDGNVVPSAELMEMLPTASSPSLADGQRYGLGLIRFDTSAGVGYGHGGNVSGYYTLMLEVPAQATSIVVSLNDDKSNDAMYDIVHRLGVALGAP